MFYMSVSLLHRLMHVSLSFKTNYWATLHFLKNRNWSLLFMFLGHSFTWTCPVSRMVSTKLSHHLGRSTVALMASCKDKCGSTVALMASCKDKCRSSERLRAFRQVFAIWCRHRINRSNPLHWLGLLFYFKIYFMSVYYLCAIAWVVYFVSVPSSPPQRLLPGLFSCNLQIRTRWLDLGYLEREIDWHNPPVDPPNHMGQFPESCPSSSSQCWPPNRAW